MADLSSSEMIESTDGREVISKDLEQHTKRDDGIPRTARTISGAYTRAKPASLGLTGSNDSQMPSISPVLSVTSLPEEEYTEDDLYTYLERYGHRPWIQQLLGSLAREGSSQDAKRHWKWSSGDLIGGLNTVHDIDSHGSRCSGLVARGRDKDFREHVRVLRWTSKDKWLPAKYNRARGLFPWGTKLCYLTQDRVEGSCMAELNVNVYL